MPRYVVERLFDPRKVQLGPKLSQRSIRLIRERFPDIVWEHSHILESDDDGVVRTFCIYSAPDEDTIRQHAAALADHTVVNVHPIAGDVAPADIPPEGAPTPERYFQSG